MRIEKPNWLKLFLDSNSPTHAEDLNNWFQENVEPVNQMLIAGVEVYCSKPNDNEGWWADQNALVKHDHKALLINITKIKKESAEDVLRDFMGAFSTRTEPFSQDAMLIHYNRAKAILGESDD